MAIDVHTAGDRSRGRGGRVRRDAVRMEPARAVARAVSPAWTRGRTRHRLVRHHEGRLAGDDGDARAAWHGRRSRLDVRVRRAAAVRVDRTAACRPGTGPPRGTALAGG